MTDTKSDTQKFEDTRDEANKSDLVSSPALNDDAETDSGATAEQDLPEGNRFKD